MVIANYIALVQKKFLSGEATEHSYRPALEYLFENIMDGISALNEPKRKKYGAPDFIINRRNMAVGHVEAKDIAVDLTRLKGRESEQKQRYLKALPNLIYTNGLDFEFYRSGQLIAQVSIGDPLMGIQPKPKQFTRLEQLLIEFLSQQPQPITSTQNLAQIMAGKAILIKDILGAFLKDEQQQSSELALQYSEFKRQLIHDLNIDDFADIYAETLAYGMFAARLHDDTPDTFNRQEALEFLPKSNPFLRQLFVYIAGPNLDDSIRWIIDDLAEVFRACDLASLMRDFGKLSGRDDPFLHFYENFLSAYNPEKRKARGVWYTPEPVVNFLVRAVDDVLQSEFGLAEGLADTSKVTIDWDTGQGKKTRKDVHRVQILDPATGTGTFLAEVIKQIAPKIKNVAESLWSHYIEKDLIPRIHGFELLMASYAMCHMKLDMILTELGYRPTATQPRLGVYLTNSLEEGAAANYTLPFAQWLSNEARDANTIKRDMPIMCVIGNPPYKGESANKGEWMAGLMEAYKKEPNSKHKLQERNPKWINDDYVKFIRLSEHMIDKNGEGILAFITNHGYLDNPTFRGMRWHLLKTFDSIYVVDLHGNTKKKEVSPDGSPDKNVFDIQQGVAMIVAVKKKMATERPKKNSVLLAQVFHHELWGSRNRKYEDLREGTLANIQWTTVNIHAPKYLFSKFDYSKDENYLSYFSIADFFNVNGRPAPGIVTTHDQFAISWNKEESLIKINKFISSSNELEARKYFRLCSQKQWNYENAKSNLVNANWQSQITNVLYRPFDVRTTVYNSHVAVHRRERMTQHFLRGSNIGIITSRMTKGEKFCHVFLSNSFSEAIMLSPKTSNNAFQFPLYLYPSPNDLDQSRRLNFNPAIHAKIVKAATHPDRNAPDEMVVFDYIYGVLHSPAYRERYKEFLKIDFPRIPYPSTPALFWDIAEKGGRLRRLHLMEPSAVGAAPYPLKGDGSNVVEKPKWQDGCVYINSNQYFADVPKISWEFYIGGYQPAQKWLKDRKERTLSFDDVRHYQKIIKVLLETHRIMHTIELPL